MKTFLIIIGLLCIALSMILSFSLGVGMVSGSLVPTKTDSVVGLGFVACVIGFVGYVAFSWIFIFSNWFFHKGA